MPSRTYKEADRNQLDMLTVVPWCTTMGQIDLRASISACMVRCQQYFRLIHYNFQLIGSVPVTADNSRGQQNLHNK